MDFIYEAENVISKELCDEIIDKFERDPNKGPGKIGDGRVDFSVKKTIDLYSPIFKEWETLHSKIIKICQHHTLQYTKQINTKNRGYNSFLKRILYTCPQVQKTEPGGFFSWHDDFIDDRMLSYILYLNTIEEDAGGTTEFECGKVIKPVQGKLIIFPSTWTYTHRGNKLIKGVKYICTCFGINIKINNHS